MCVFCLLAKAGIKCASIGVKLSFKCQPFNILNCCICAIGVGTVAAGVAMAATLFRSGKLIIHTSV